MAEKLDKIIKIGENDYEVQATQSDVAAVANKLSSSLTINKYNLGGESSVVFDGSGNRSISIVPADGGHFNGRVTTVGIGKSTDKTSVLNWGEVETKVVDYALNRLKNHSAVYAWDGTTLASPAKDTVISISIVTGPESKIADFTSKNHDDKNYADKNPDDKTVCSLAAFLYISSDTHAIYFGTNAAAGDYHLLSSNKAKEAIKLTTAKRIITDLEKVGTAADNANFDGSSNFQAGVTGVLGTANGGTGADDLADVTVGTANMLRDANDAKKTATASAVLTNADEITKIKSGTTIVSKAASAANAEKLAGLSPDDWQRKITISTAQPSGGEFGDIWIVYKV